MAKAATTDKLVLTRRQQHGDFDEIDTLHGLLRVALDDARKVDRYRYRPKGLNWHSQRKPGKRCKVCLAGFVMAGHLQASRKASLDPNHYQQQTGSRLLAIDALRCGDIRHAFHHLHGRRIPVLSLPYCDMRNQAKAVKDFKSWKDWDAAVPVYEHLHDVLKEAGL